MNLKNLLMWMVIVVLVIGLFNLFQNPDKKISTNEIAFSKFLKEVDEGRVVEVEIKGNTIPILKLSKIIAKNINIKMKNAYFFCSCFKSNHAFFDRDIFLKF